MEIPIGKTAEPAGCFRDLSKADTFKKRGKRLKSGNFRKSEKFRAIGAAVP